MLFNDMVLVTRKQGPKKHQCMTAIPLKFLLVWAGTQCLLVQKAITVIGDNKSAFLSPCADSADPLSFVILHTDKRAKFSIATGSEDDRRSEETINEAINATAILNRKRDATMAKAQEN